MIGVRVDGRKELAAITDRYRESTESWVVAHASQCACCTAELDTPGCVGHAQGICSAKDIDQGQDAVKAFELDYDAKYPKAVAKIADVLLEFYKYPLGTGSTCAPPTPIESTFATVRLHERVTKGPRHAQPQLPWPTSSSTPQKPAGAKSTPLNWSPSSEPRSSIRQVPGSTSTSEFVLPRHSS